VKRRSTGLPTLVVKCATCRERKLAEFDLGPGGPSQTHHTVGAWSGPDSDDKVHLRCPCGHGRQVPRQQILGELATVSGEKTIYL
jgi:hypothetical protein